MVGRGEGRRSQHGFEILSTGTRENGVARISGVVLDFFVSLPSTVYQYYMIGKFCYLN